MARRTQADWVADRQPRTNCPKPIQLSRRRRTGIPTVRTLADKVFAAKGLLGFHQKLADQSRMRDASGL